MPFEITHAILGQAIVTTNGGSWGKSILLGCLFPDIRYLAKIDRSLTHVEEDVRETDLKNDFQTGMRLHCQIDRIWDEAIAELQFTNTNPSIPDIYYTSLLKAVHEEIAWKQPSVAQFDLEVEDLVQIMNLPDMVSKQQVEEWYAGLADYFSEGPTRKGLIKLGQLLQFPQPVISELWIYFQELKKDMMTVRKLMMIHERMLHYLLEE